MPGTVMILVSRTIMIRLLHLRKSVAETFEVIHSTISWETGGTNDQNHETTYHANFEKLIMRLSGEPKLLLSYLS